MIKEALQYIAGLANTRTEAIGDQIFSTQPVHLVRQARAEAIKVRSLSGMVEYLKSEFDGKTKLLIQVVSPTEVHAFGTFNRDLDRNYLITASALLPEFRYGNFYESEDFNIKLQSGFVPSHDRAAVLALVGNIREDAVKTVGDDGVSQSVTARTGVATVAPVPVPNPVTLQPFRTFVEVEQPESEFIFRIKQGPTCALFEADGGAWKLEAMYRIKNYLLLALEEKVNSGEIVIIA
ncbi:hypothetical protein [Paenibacillus oleatilyticus]|uniref:Uncharacterized protein n=1 Tax=Paenibacillus oleatilyticus TaxID=2594886 RepID=A0ABV4UVI1_9BACL